MKKLFYATLCKAVAVLFFAVFSFLSGSGQAKLVGTTGYGGNQFGTIFSIEPGATTLLTQQNLDGVPGINPTGNMIKASNGKLYGMTANGGNTGDGMIFEYDPDTDVYTKKADFESHTTGFAIDGSLVQAPNGKLYGVADFGGVTGCGVLFELDIATNALTAKVSFDELDNRGAFPYGTLALASNGKLYGQATTPDQSGGIIFEYDPSTDTYARKFDIPGVYLAAGPMREAGGLLYGTNGSGGATGEGAIFGYDFTANTYNELIDLTASSGTAISNMILAANNKFYGTTLGGGANGVGVVFEYDYIANNYAKKVDLITATGSQGSGIGETTAGKLYGYTGQGGANNLGVIFEYDYIANSYTKKIDLVSINGNGPSGTPTLAANGKIYGIATFGGVEGGGTLFEYDFVSNIYTKKKDLGTSITGTHPIGKLTKAPNGKLYGVATGGGVNEVGVIYEYDYATGIYTKKIDLSVANGFSPTAPMMVAANGKLYGTTDRGGANDKGVIYEYDYTTNTYTKKIDLSVANGSSSRCTMVEVTNGILYGTTLEGGANNKGVIYEYNYTTNTYTKKFDFTVALGTPWGRSLLLAANGKLYSSTFKDNTHSGIYEYDYVGNIVTEKKVLTAATDGTEPQDPMIEAPNGKLYSACVKGGANDAGVIYEYDYVNNIYTKKIDLLASTGSSPAGGMLLSSVNGKMYGLLGEGADNLKGGVYEYDYINNIYTLKYSFATATGYGPVNAALTEIGGACTPASQPVLSADDETVCIGTQVTLSIQSGQLNESDHWAWYSGSCGGTPIGTGASINFIPVATDTYYARGEGACTTNGDCGNITVTVSSSLTAAVSIVSNAGNTVCLSESVTFTATPTNGGTTPSYQWKKNGNDVGTDSDTYTDGSLNNGDAITCELTSSESCVSNSPVTSNTIVMTVNNPTNSSTNISVCPNELPYSWNGNSYPSPGTYQVRLTNAGGCDSVAILHLSVNTLPVPGITNNTGTTQISCAITSISVTATGGVNYSWSNGLGTDANATIIAAGTYTVTVTDANGCSAQASITVTANPNGPAAPDNIDGPTNVCPFIGTGDQLVYTAAPVTGATSYQWTVPSTVNIISGQGTNILTVTIGNGFIASANKQLRVRAIAACGTSLYAIKYLVAQIPGSIPAITGPTDVCPYLGNGAEAIYSIPASAGATTYQWSVPPGAFITQDNGTNIRVVFINGYTTGPVSVFAINGCGQSNTRSLTVKLTLPSRPGIISGVSNACLFMPSAANPTGVPATYSVAKVAGITYNWVVPSGASIGLHNSTATTDYIEVNFTAAYTTGNISVTANNGCGASPERVFTLSSHMPSAPSPITGGQIQPCPDRQFRYTITSMPSNAVSAEWTVPAGATIVSGQGTVTVVIAVPSTAFTGVVSVVGNNGCGNSAPRSVNINVPACGSFTRVANSESVGKEKVVTKPTATSMEVNVFPNPTTTASKLQVITAGKEKISVRLMDAQGRSFKTFEIMPYQTVEIGAGLKAGVYILEVMQADKIKTTRLIKF